MLSKAERIRRLYAAGKSDQEIAEIVGCGRAYVRTAARQRVDGRRSANDRRYDRSPAGQIRSKLYRLRSAASQQAANSAWNRVVEATGDRAAANTAARAAYAAARAAGKSIKDAHRAAKATRLRVLRQTSDKAKARAASRKARRAAVRSQRAAEASC